MLSACGSLPPRQEADEEGGWRPCDPEAAPELARPMVGILRRIQDGLYRRRSADTFWDEELSLVCWEWTDSEKVEWRKRLPGDSTLDLQWRDVEFSRTGEFARCELREIEKPRRGRERYKDVNWSGKVLFRKVATGWRLRSQLPFALGAGDGTWEEILVTEARAMELRSQRARMAGKPVPAWATDDEVIRILGEGLALHQERRVFPLSAFMQIMLGNNLVLRRHAHKIVTATFGVDFGLSEKPFDAFSESSFAWFKGWKDWISRTYPKGHELVPLP